MTTTPKPIAIYYEHPDWFRLLFAELERRSLGYVAIEADQHHYDPAESESDYSLLFNRMSPSAYLRGHGQGIFYTLAYLEHLERLGTRVINGRKAFAIEISKALQLSLLSIAWSSVPTGARHQPPITSNSGEPRFAFSDRGESECRWQRRRRRALRLQRLARASSDQSNGRSRH